MKDRYTAFIIILLPIFFACGGNKGIKQTGSIPCLPQDTMVYTSLTVDESPVVMKHETPLYPRNLKKHGITGIVKVQFIINQTGHVTEISVLSSPNNEFSTAAMKAIKKWIYRPGKIKGIPVKVRRDAEVEFRL
jgi:protein TonB